MDSSSLQALERLLDPPKRSEEEEEEELDRHHSTPYATPAAIGLPAAVAKKEAETGKGGEGREEKSKGIWDNAEVSEQQHYEYDDPRPQPKYDVVFRQTVGAEDVFLGMGRKNPTTACCEEMLVRIVLPDVQAARDVDLDVTDTFLDCRTSSHRLGLHLPHRVDSKKSKAQWLGDSHTLEVCLQLDREYDFLNQ